MIRTNFTLEELEHLDSVPMCPCIEFYCSDYHHITKYWNRIPFPYDLGEIYCYAPLPLSDEQPNTHYYRAPEVELLIALVWTPNEDHTGEVFRYLRDRYMELWNATKDSPQRFIHQDQELAPHHARIRLVTRRTRRRSTYTL